MASYDASTLTNESKRSARIYKDLNLDFQQNTATKDIQKLMDIEAVKRSVRNLINTNHSKNIELLITNYEPRCRLVQVNTQPMFDRNGYAVQISFYVVNYPEPVEVETFLERLR